VSNEKYRDVLGETYKEAIRAIDEGDFSAVNSLDEEVTEWINIITTSPENRRGALAVLVTSLTKKIGSPTQDIRYHQENMQQGYSGRTLDTKIVSPFLREKGFPSMKESGWLTRSFEQNRPYDKDYPGKITPTELKTAFLNVIDAVQNNSEIARPSLIYVLIRLEKYRRLQVSQPIIKLPDEIAKKLTVSTIIGYLERHFNAYYAPGVTGAARLPVLALYSVYKCLIQELTRFEEKKLLPLESHTSPDSRSGRMGDIDVVTENDIPYEAVEVKFRIPINLSMVQFVHEKIKSTSIQRYYVLSTSDVVAQERESIAILIAEVKEHHGCEIIVNGVVPSLKYYLRLLSDTQRFLEPV